MSKRRLYFIALALLVVGAHIAMLTSDRMPLETALRLTLVNASIWGLIALPALYFWMRKRAKRAADER